MIKLLLFLITIVSDVKSICDEIVIMRIEGEEMLFRELVAILLLSEMKSFLLDEEYENNLEGNYYVKDRISKDNKII